MGDNYEKKKDLCKLIGNAEESLYRIQAYAIKYHKQISAFTCISENALYNQAHNSGTFAGLCMALGIIEANNYNCSYDIIYQIGRKLFAKIQMEINYATSFDIVNIYEDNIQKNVKTISISEKEDIKQIQDKLNELKSIFVQQGVNNENSTRCT